MVNCYFCGTELCTRKKCFYSKYLKCKENDKPDIYCNGLNIGNGLTYEKINVCNDCEDLTLDHFNKIPKKMQKEILGMKL